MEQYVEMLKKAQEEQQTQSDVTPPTNPYDLSSK